MEGIYELHYSAESCGRLYLVLYQRFDNGQLALVGTHESDPFRPLSDTAVWLTGALAGNPGLPHV
jgi:hypothetical protein